MNGTERALETAFLAATTWPLLRVYASPGFRRKLHAFPGAAHAIGTGLVALWGVIAVLAIGPLPVLRAVAALLAVAVAWLVWRARPAYGRRRGLPPGSLALLPAAPWRDQRYFERQAAHFGPVFKVAHAIEPMICVVGLPKALELLHGHEAQLSPSPLPFNRNVPRGFLRYMEPDAHRVYRATFRSAISREVIRDCRPIIVDEVRRGLARLAAPADSPEPTRASEPVASMVFTMFVRLFFGIDPNAPRFDRLNRLCHVIDFRLVAQRSRRAVRDALAEAEAIVREEMRQAGAQSDDAPDRRPSFLAELVRAEPGAVDDPTTVRNLLYMVHLAAGDVAGLLVWTLKKLADHPEWVSRLRDEVESTASSAEPPDTLAQRIVAETLRLEQSEYIVRRITRDIRWSGYLLPGVGSCGCAYGSRIATRRVRPPRCVRPRPLSGAPARTGGLLPVRGITGVLPRRPPHDGRRLELRHRARPRVRPVPRG